MRISPLVLPRLTEGVNITLRAGGAGMIWAKLARGLADSGLLGDQHIAKGKDVVEVVRMSLGEAVEMLQPRSPLFRFRVVVGESRENFQITDDFGFQTETGRIYLGLVRESSMHVEACIGHGLRLIDAKREGLAGIVAKTLEIALTNTVGCFGFLRARENAEHILWYGASTDAELREELEAMGEEISDEAFADYFKPSDFDDEFPADLTGGKTVLKERGIVRLLKDASASGDLAAECARKTLELRGLMKGLLPAQDSAWNWDGIGENSTPAIVLRMSERDQMVRIVDDWYSYCSQGDEGTELHGLATIEGSGEEIVSWLKSISVGTMIADKAGELLRLLDPEIKEV